MLGFCLTGAETFLFMKMQPWRGLGEAGVQGTARLFGPNVHKNTKIFSRVPRESQAQDMSLRGSVAIPELSSQGADSDGSLWALKGGEARTGEGCSGHAVLLPSE